MNTNIVELIKQAVAAANDGSWQYQAGLFAGGAVVGVLGSVVGWIGKQIWNKRKKIKPKATV